MIIPASNFNENVYVKSKYEKVKWLIIFSIKRNDDLSFTEHINRFIFRALVSRKMYIYNGQIQQYIRKKDSRGIADRDSQTHNSTHYFSDFQFQPPCMHDNW